MAIVLIKFNGGNVPVVTGDIPFDDGTPISNPTATGFVTNQAFIVAAGPYCFGLNSAISHKPLWQVVQAVDGEETEITFLRTTP
jgi:hypothetical protein